VAALKRKILYEVHIRTTGLGHDLGCDACLSQNIPVVGLSSRIVFALGVVCLEYRTVCVRERRQTETDWIDMHPTLAFSLVTIVAVLTSFLAYVFDWNETHVYNPNWPPHAKFHNAQTLMLGPLLGAVSLWLLWHRNDLHSAVLTSSLYWVAQLGSLAFPGTALIDPEFRERKRSRAPMQPLLASILLAFLVTAWVVV
jgi:hypothetical protein